MTMRRETCDVVILGAGFAGSLLAIIAKQQGRSVVLLERARHPRFAIGESSTPLANLKLAGLADTYDLPWLTSLTKYGPWKRDYPHIACGLKRGFSFYHHRRGEAFRPDRQHGNELMVAANPDADRGDTHWYRAEFDEFIARQAVKARVTYIDHCDVSAIEHDGPWLIRGTCDDGPVEITASFAIDATGESGRLAEALGLKRSTDGIRTCSRGLYSHFEGVALWADILETGGHRLVDHPFPCDAAALHHLIDGGWMWVLRFDNGITSAGFSLDSHRRPLDLHISPEAEWRELLAAYPSIQRQFADATPVRPFTRTARMQRRLSVAAGEDWAALPFTASFLDPWLSPGIAYTLFGVERLARILGEHWFDPNRANQLACYSRTLFREMQLLDRITSACLSRMDSFPIVTAITMLYFTAAIFTEERIRAGQARPDDAFLLADDERFVSLAVELCDVAHHVAPTDVAAFVKRVATAIHPYNTVGLCDPERRNMYPFTGST
ncbi:MAG: tryptophan 7-halogenase [Planctomycetes bacterium]|nr:tryptophan 7-halogenase [Planctomycetota bacterium]